MAWKDTAGRTIRPTCRAGVRHWFTAYGYPGLRAPSCQRCGAPNPRPLTTDEQAEYDYHQRRAEERARVRDSVLQSTP